MRLSPRLFLLVAVATAASSTDSIAAPQEPALQVDWFRSPINGLWYGVDYTPRSWTDSEALAVSLGGHLATIRSQVEQDWIEHELGAYLPPSGLLIGLNDQASEGNFTWGSGDPVTYTNWAAGQPDNAGGVEDFVHLFGSDAPVVQWQWNDMDLAGTNIGDPLPLIELHAEPARSLTWPEAHEWPNTGDGGLWSAMEDLDGDSEPEWVVPNHGSGSTSTGSSVQIYSFNQGQWQFSSEVDCGARRPHEVAIVDLDEDGLLDLAISCYQDQELIWLRGLGSLQFETPVTLGSGKNFYRIQGVDIDGDGQREGVAATTRQSRELNLYQLGESAHTWQLAGLGAGAYAVQVESAELNGDGRNDIVVSGGNGCAVLLSDPSTAPSTTGYQPPTYLLPTGGPSNADAGNNLALGDLDHDGAFDIVSHGNGTAAQGCVMVVWLNDGSGQFTQHSIHTSDASIDMDSGDIDSDGELDVFVAMDNSKMARVFFGLGDGTFEPPQTVQLMTGNGNNVTFGEWGTPKAPGLALSGYSGFTTWQCSLNDCNSNGIPDVQDINSGTSHDCNANGIPDECDIDTGEALDCNGNGIPDSCDIDSGSELDCNADGVPDSCELYSGTALDCNGNGIPDECDIDAGASDCDMDGVPDSCQIDADVTLDLNGNMALDACEAIGTTYCSPAVSNSTGLSGEVTLLGSELIVLNQFFVSARQLPPSSFGFFIASTVPGSINPVPNSQGTLCVIGDVGRGVGGGIFNAGLAGAYIGYANLLSMPQPNGPIAVLAGETWHFQAWYRDAIGGQTTSNFTDAVAVTFQ
ncbi:FG-GAP-like repeat-containing protein [Planctomycetota bacterium]|nr:FG-GAP-like repeat-containing protein [Planctomycetota bacterium]